MRYALIALVLLFGALQYRLWLGTGGVQDVQRLQRELADRRSELVRLEERNAALTAEVIDLKSGLDAIEERARSELGMIDENETFYQFVRERGRRRAPVEQRAGDEPQGGDSSAIGRERDGSEPETEAIEAAVDDAGVADETLERDVGEPPAAAQPPAYSEPPELVEPTGDVGQGDVDR